jgi:hypothetical protein
MKPLILAALAPCILAAIAAPARASQYPAPRAASDTSSYGKHFQRSMSLMATSTPQKRNTVRILFYGQSIVGQNWHTMVMDDLTKRYPNTDFDVKNLAIGGFSSQLLVKTMHYDVFSFYPDLIVFHVYGSHTEYENIIKEFRTRTAAEVIMQSDHANKWPEPKTSGNFWVEQTVWEDKTNYFLLPAVAEKYGCAWQPQRWEWAQYLKDNTMQPPALLKDGVHLNEHGRWLMAELLKRFMVHLPKAPRSEWQDLSKTYAVGTDLKWRGDRLTLEFEGNRVVALAARGAQADVNVLIDGKKPSTFPECYSFTRPSGTPCIGWPAISKISWEQPPVLEKWTATCRGFNDSQTDFQFTLRGSVSGEDGNGRGAERFVSKSKRVVIEPQDWVFEYDKKVGNRSATDGWEVRWEVIPLFADVYSPPNVTDPTRDHPTVLASNLANGKHRLELVASGHRKPSIAAIRIYKPPYR